MVRCSSRHAIRVYVVSLFDIFATCLHISAFHAAPFLLTKFHLGLKLLLLLLLPTTTTFTYYLLPTTTTTTTTSTTTTTTTTTATTPTTSSRSRSRE
jgi:hypothetical protein